MACKEAFEKRWKEYNDGVEESWVESKRERKRRLVSRCVEQLESAEVEKRGEGLECLTYIVLGVWGETAGLKVEKKKEEGEGKEEAWDCDKQLGTGREGAELIAEVGGVQAVFDVLRGACLRER